MREIALAGLAIGATVALAPHASADPPTPYLKLPSTKCQVEVDSAWCEGVFLDAPIDPCTNPKCPEVLHMDQAVVNADGTFYWRDANIGNPNAGGPGWFTLGAGQTYRVNGWTVQRVTDDHTTFTNDATGHGMSVAPARDRGPQGEVQNAVNVF
ncbi:MAG: hypothetical protein ACRDTV_16055 [Mycobacterium sp.]